MKKVNYELLARQLEALAEEEQHYLPLLSNTSALLMETMDQLNWAGFYLMRRGELILGPFQGKPACIHIGMGKGVCGTAADEDRTVRVADVHLFPGHIACDGASSSEIVIPLHKEGKVVGVLDLDSPVKERFSQEDQQGLEFFVSVLEKLVDLSDWMERNTEI